MKTDLVERAAAAVRGRYDGASDRAARTETHVLLALEKTRSRRRTWQLTGAIPLMAALLASGAWAAAGERLRAKVRDTVHAWSAPRGSAPLAARAATGIANGTGVAPSPTQATAELAPASEVPAETTPSASSSAQSAASARPRGHAFSVAARPSSEAPAPATVEPAQPSASEVDIDALYRAAHRAQFSDHDPAHALELWDRYLAAAPNGSLSPEARYNRAIDLARLGRKAEAAAALEPFARGDYGAYRQVEAAALVHALRTPTNGEP